MEILMLCDYRHDIAATVVEHIEAIRRHSRHRVTVLSILGDLPRRLELERFDVVIVHYSLVMCMDEFVSPPTRKQLSDFSGLKAAFIQDEYRFVDRTIAAMREIGVELLFTCVPEPEIEKVYPRERLPDVVKVNVLTGYVPELLKEIRPKTYEKRPIDIGYRSRFVPEWLGEMGLEKTQIGQRMTEDAKRFGLFVDCSTREVDRLYGRRWINFIQSCKAMLGVESGASVFDFSGEIKERVEAHKARDSSISFEVLQQLYFKDKENLIDLRQISPRCFEAACLGSLMILYEGRYSGVLEPWRHYVPLKKDHSNMAEVVDAIRDVDRAKQIIENARIEVAFDEKWSYATFAKKVDAAIEDRFEVRHAARSPHYERPKFEATVFAHRVSNRLVHARRRIFNCAVNNLDAGIRTLLPSRLQAPVKKGIKRGYALMMTAVGRRPIS